MVKPRQTIDSDSNPNALLERLQVEQGIDETWAQDVTIRPGSGSIRALEGSDSVANLPSISTSMRKAHVELELLDKLGAGGMGEVYLARQRSLKRDVAVKQLNPEHHDPRSAEALLREAQLTGGLEHPGIVPVHAIGQNADGMPVMVMKRVEGVTWLDLIADPEHPKWSEISAEPLTHHVEILIDVCQALELAHSRGVLHLDIKPENVMLGDFGEVYLMDWGVAVELERREVLGKTVVGTPIYMAPEILSGVVRSDERTDIFLLGATLHEVLTGEPLYTGSNTIEILGQVMRCEPKRYGSGIPTELAKICQRACSKDPDERFASVRDFREALSAGLRNRGARQLTEAASRRLAELERLLEAEDEQIVSIYEAFGEARFGFEQSLRDWPESERAREGLERCLLRMFDFELEAGNIAPAKALLEALPESQHEELRRRLERRREAIESTLDAQRELEDLRRETSFRSQSWTKSAIAVLHGVLWVAMLLGLDHQLATGAWVITPQTNLMIGAAAFVQVYALFFILRRTLFDNTVRRQFMLAAMVYITAFLLNRSMAYFLTWTFELTLLIDFLLLFAFVGTVAALASPAFWWAAGALGCFGLLAAYQPQLSVELHAATAFILNFLAAYILRPTRGPPEQKQV